MSTPAAFAELNDLVLKQRADGNMTNEKRMLKSSKRMRTYQDS